MMRLLLLLGMALALAGCQENVGAGAGAPGPSGGLEAGLRVSAVRGPVAGAALTPEGEPDRPVELGAAPASHPGQVGARSNSYYGLTTGPGAWMAALSGLHGESALFVHPDRDFSAPALCSAVSFLASTEACTVVCAGPTCSYGIRVYGFDDTPTPFLLTVQ